MIKVSEQLKPLDQATDEVISGAQESIRKLRTITSPLEMWKVQIEHVNSKSRRDILNGVNTKIGILRNSLQNAVVATQKRLK